MSQLMYNGQSNSKKYYSEMQFVYEVMEIYKFRVF